MKSMNILNFPEGNDKKGVGLRGTLRVIRAETWLTFTARLPYWCNRNTRPKSTELFCNVGLFGDVFV